MLSLISSSYRAACSSDKAAALRFGFQYEGLFRQDRIVKGRNRNTAWFSIIDEEWSDLEHFIKEGVENYMPQIMAILYRPIVEQKNDKYTIEAYTSNIDVRAELFKNMKAENVQSAMVFFYHLGKELLKILQLFLIHKMQTKKEQLQQMILRKNGGTLA